MRKLKLYGSRMYASDFFQSYTPRENRQVAHTPSSLVRERYGVNARMASSGMMSAGFISIRKLAGSPAPNIKALDISHTLHNGVRAGVWYT